MYDLFMSFSSTMVTSLFAFCSISELIERETEEYHKADPDPFDDRHPGKPASTWLSL